VTGSRPSPVPAGIERLDEALVAPLVPERPESGHKGTFGSLLAVCGSLDYAGAALLAGTAALRAGTGLVTLAVPASLQPVVAGRVPELITLGLPERAAYETDPGAALVVLAARRRTALLVGPGLRPGAGTDELVLGLVRAADAPAGDAAGTGATGAGAAGTDAGGLIVDAEGLNALSRTERWWERARPGLVLTPHPGEFERLDGRPVGRDDAERAARATEAAARWRQVVVLKGARTVVAAPDGRAAVAGSANPALGSGGTGDVLAGVIGGLLAQGLGPWDAARLGVHLHAVAGEHVRERLGDAGLLASDLLPELPRVRRHLARTVDRGRPDGRRVGFRMDGGEVER
jgi:NAD(P)H-hydrate epimerase